MAEGVRTMKLDKETLKWVLTQIRGYINDDFYDYCSAIESLKMDIKNKLEEEQ
jgi:hypothetical protein